MRYVLMILGLALVVWVVYTKQHAPVVQQQAQQRVLPQPPPPVAAPAPVLSNAEIQRVYESSKDMDPNIRWESVKFLSQMNIPQIESILADKLAHDPDASVRKNVLNLILDRHGPRMADYLLMALKDENADVRVTALQALAKSGDYGAASAISETLSDPDQRVRLAALTALNMLQSKRNAEIKQEQDQQEAARQEYLRKQAEMAAQNGK